MLRRICFSLILVTAAVPAYASSLWDWSYSTAGVSANGTFTTDSTPNAQGGYQITGITGTRNGVVITLLQPTGTAIPGNQPYAVDNLVFQGSGPQLSSNGFGFGLADGTYANPFYADFLPTPAYLEFFSDPATGKTTELTVNFSATLVSTPEPATCGLLFFSLLLLPLGRRGRVAELRQSRPAK